MGQQLTVVCRDNSNARYGYEAVLIYHIEADPDDEDAIREAIVEIREGEVDEVDKDDIELLFAFAGYLTTVVDWRG